MDWQTKTFNELTTLELFHIYKLRTAVFVVEQNCAYQEVDDIDLTAVHLFNPDFTAYARIYQTEDYIKIGRVIVAKEARGAGLARELMLQAVKFCEKFAKPLQVQAQSYLQDFYKSFGFKLISDVYLEDGIPHLDMVRES